MGPWDWLCVLSTFKLKSAKMLGSRWPFGSTPDKDLGPSCRQVMHLGESLLQIIQKKLKARKIQKVFSSSSKLQLVRMLWTIKEWQWHIQMCWQFLKHPGNVGAETKATSCMLLSLIICVLQQHLKKRQLAASSSRFLSYAGTYWVNLNSVVRLLLLLRLFQVSFAPRNM